MSQERRPSIKSDSKALVTEEEKRTRSPSSESKRSESTSDTSKKNRKKNKKNTAANSPSLLSVSQSISEDGFSDTFTIRSGNCNDRTLRDFDTSSCQSKTPSSTSVLASGRVQQLPRHMMADNSKAQKKFATKLAKQQVPKRIEKGVKMSLFSHLVQMERDSNMCANISLYRASIHPCFVTFGLQCAEGIVFDCNERCVRLIESLRTFIRDYETPPEKDFTRDFEPRLSPSLSFLAQCRPFSSGMGTIIKFLKLKLYESFTLTDDEIKKAMIEFLAKFQQERINLAEDVIVSNICSKIDDEEVILTYSMSKSVSRALIKASKEENKKIRVIVADSKPRFEGKKMIKSLAENDIKCTYIALNGLCYVMEEVTKIIMGVNSVLVNGAVMASVGSAMVAAVGKSKNVPLLVCCETYHFSERAQTDAFVYNELGDPDDIVLQSQPNCAVVDNWKNFPNITLLNLFYDIIPSKFVDAIITELGIIPCSSAPVVLRIKN